MEMKCFKREESQLRHCDRKYPYNMNLNVYAHWPETNKSDLKS